MALVIMFGIPSFIIWYWIITIMSNKESKERNNYIIKKLYEDHDKKYPNGVPKQ